MVERGRVRRLAERMADLMSGFCIGLPEQSDEDDAGELPLAVRGAKQTGGAIMVAECGGGPGECLDSPDRSPEVADIALAAQRIAEYVQCKVGFAVAQLGDAGTPQGP